MSHSKTESATFIMGEGLRIWSLNYPSFEVLSPLPLTDLVICEHVETAIGGNFEWVIPTSYESFQSSPDFGFDLRAWDLLSDEALLNFERGLT